MGKVKDVTGASYFWPGTDAVGAPFEDLAAQDPDRKPLPKAFWFGTGGTLALRNRGDATVHLMKNIPDGFHKVMQPFEILGAGDGSTQALLDDLLIESN